MDFVECRALELDEMMSAVSESVIGGSRSVMQLLPRHMRRRAANHDVRRLPLKRRLEAQNDVIILHSFVCSTHRHHSGLVVAHLTAVREGPGSNLAAGKSLCFHKNHCDTQLCERAAH